MTGDNYFISDVPHLLHGVVIFIVRDAFKKKRVNFGTSTIGTFELGFGTLPTYKNHHIVK